MSSRTLETPISTPPAAAPARQVAVIDIGTASVRMAVAEISATGQVRQLETLAQAVNLGKDAKSIPSAFAFLITCPSQPISVP